jgi:hypothetical protein
MWLAIVPALVLWVTGCGGIQASHSISPASFLLPGLLKNNSIDPTIPSLAQTQSLSPGVDPELTRNLTQSN